MNKFKDFVTSDVKTYHWLIMMGYLAYISVWLDRRRSGEWK